MGKVPQIIRVKYHITGLTKAKKQLTQLQKLFDRLVVSGKKAGLTRKEISDMIKMEVSK